jgi:acetyl-CoA acetyltransferase family protein
VRTSNIAREAALGAGIPDGVPAHTVTMACISANQAIATGASYIMSGQADVVLAGGVETMSDVPIRFSRGLRQRMLASRKARGFGDYLKLLKGLSLKDLAPEAPAIAEFSTGEVMGHSSDRLAARWGVTRKEQDEFALRSHHNAAAASKDGRLAREIVPVDGIQEDTGVRGDSTIEKLSSLKPAFVRPHGTHTAANSSFLTDGASAVLIMRESKAKALGYEPLAAIKDWIFVSQDPREELLLGPAYAISRILARNNLKQSQVAVWELHEAFAGQVLSNLRALESEKFATELAKVKRAVGSVDMAKINTMGGSLSIGHPFGATGGRLITTTANRMIDENGEFGILAACAAGGQGHAMILERC